METITVNKRDNNYEITMHKDFTNLTITKDKEYLDVRVPFHYKDVKYQSMDMKDYIAMVEEIERREELEVLEILKKRNIID